MQFATEDSIARAHSLGLSGGSDPDPASFSHQAPAVGLQWTGVGDPHQRETPLRPRPTAALQKAGLHPGVEQGSQPRSERPIQSRRYQGQCTARTISGFLPEIKPTMVRLTLARKIAAITLTLWKKGENFDAEKLKPRRLSVSVKSPFHFRGSSLVMADRFWRRSGSRVSMLNACRRMVPWHPASV